MLTLLTLLGCTTRRTMHTGTFEEEPYELVEVETKGFSTNSIHYEIRSDRFRTMTIDATTTDWGPPYADDLYGNAPRLYLTNNPIPYRNEPDNTVQHPGTMVYLSPERFGRDEYDLYTRFMKSEWPTIDRQFGRAAYSRFPHLIGLVYGEQTQFVRTFRGQQRGGDYIIRVEVDGRVRYGTPTLSAEEYSGLSEKVQMPGKLIYRATGLAAGLTLTQLQTYKDETGKTLSDYFDLREKP